ncbi:hypothetical protein GARC_4816 [Paraglaciecola arctica BSs20135]|uniref:Uncharacterized protein n=1 Tax=Paraglaciecola arctica BSs20135 TaxID=493475 RepID=K6YYD5_9ALTE|nr:hypothetical protein GARC_4816 [Paraglaciecola arctica BSs20135]
MTFIKIKSISAWRLGLTILLTIFFFSGYITQASATLPLKTQSNSNTSSEQLWEGGSAGYIAQGDPTNDDVAFLIYLGHVQAAIGRANHYDKEEGMSNPFTSRILSEYAVIDPFVSGKSSSSLSLQPLLSKVAAPETFTTIMDRTPSKRMQRNAIHTQMKTLILGVDAIVTERFPSIQTSALTMSALFREAGELLRTGLSINGKILDIAQYRDAIQLMEASLRLRVNKVISCDRSREAIKQLKGNGPLGDLLDRLIIVSKSGTVNGNAGDVFEAAQKLEQLGANLPSDDAQICQ